MKTTLSFRLMAFHAMVATATAVLTLWLGEMIVEHQMLRGTDLIIETEFAEISVLLNERGPESDPEEITTLLMDHTLIDAAVFYFQVQDAGGDVIYQSRNLVGTRIPGESKKWYSTRLSDLNLHTGGPEGMPIRVGSFHAGSLEVRIAASMVAHLAVQRQFHLLMAMAVPVVFLLSLGVGFILSQMMLKPLRAIESTARRIGANNLRERIPVPASGDEVSRLAELLNDTFERIEQAFEQVRRFTADSSHELRTPLSIIRLQAEKLLESPTLSTDQRDSLQELQDEASRLERVINQLLLLARAESKVFALDLQSHNVQDYVSQFAEDAEALADSEGCQFLLRENQPGNLRFDASWMRQVLFNILSNAIKHSPEGGKILLSSCIEGGHWHLTLEDEGPGVPADQLERIFERFTKVTGAGEQQEGAGLGLAVCRSIIEMHQGTIRAERVSEEGGFRILIRV